LGPALFLLELKGERGECWFIGLTSPVALIATPSFGEYLIEKALEHAGKDARQLGIRWFFYAGEPGGETPRPESVSARDSMQRS